jgi:hypothetical protein
MTVDYTYMRRELQSLSDADLYTRTVSLLNHARWMMDEDGTYDPIDRAWTSQAWAIWCERGKPEQYEAALEQVRKEGRR